MPKKVIEEETAEVKTTEVSDKPKIPITETDKKILELVGQYMEMYLDKYILLIGQFNTLQHYPTQKLEILLNELRGEKYQLSRSFLNQIKAIKEEIR